MDLFAMLGSQLMVVLLFVLGMGVAVFEYAAVARDRVRRVDVKLRRRAARRIAV